MSGKKDVNHGIFIKLEIRNFRFVKLKAKEEEKLGEGTLLKLFWDQLIEGANLMGDQLTNVDEQTNKKTTQFFICLCISQFDFVKSTSTLSMECPGLLDIGASHVTCARLTFASYQSTNDNFALGLI